MGVLIATRSDVSLDAVRRVAWEGEPVEIAPAALAVMDRCHAALAALVEARLAEDPGALLYGMTTAPGDGAAVALTADAQERRPTRLWTAHSFGEPLPERVVRAILLARLTNFVEGHAAVRGALAQAVAAMLDAPPPPVPAQGNGGATDVGVTPQSIKVGHIGIYSGPVGSFGDDLSYAGRAKLQEINDTGGINGRKLDVLVRDDAWDGTKGMNAMRDLVDREKVFAICCIMSVNTSDPATPYLDEKKVPHIGADGWGEPQYKGQWTFPVSASAVTEAHMLAKYQAEQQQARNVAILYINNPTGRAYVKAYDEVIRKFGGKVVFSQPATFDDPGTTTFIAQARTQNIDTISTYLDPGIFTRMVREAAAQNYKPKNAFSGAAGLYFQVTPNFTGPNGEGTIAATHWETNDQDTPGLRAYKALVEKYYPKIDHSTWTKAGYVGATIFGNLVKSLGLEVTRQRVKDAADKLTDFDSGLGPHLTWSPGHHRANKTIYLAQIQRSGDKFEYKKIAGPLVDEYAESE
jgi:ABC-type branched-subunit amino acid transport system substrate-binding protein